MSWQHSPDSVLQRLLDHWCALYPVRSVTISFLQYPGLVCSHACEKGPFVAVEVVVQSPGTPNTQQNGFEFYRHGLEQCRGHQCFRIMGEAGSINVSSTCEGSPDPALCSQAACCLKLETLL